MQFELVGGFSPLGSPSGVAAAVSRRRLASVSTSRMTIVSASGEAPATPTSAIVLETAAVDGDEAKPAAGDVTLASMPAAEITALVHCYQKERGVTCGWVGSHFGGSHSHFDALVTETRKLVDAQRMPGKYRVMLDRARAEADTSVASAKSEAEAPPSAFRRQRSARLAPTSFYSIFLKFNELIGPLVEAHYNDELTRNSLLREPVLLTLTLTLTLNPNPDPSPNPSPDPNQVSPYTRPSPASRRPPVSSAPSSVACSRCPRSRSSTCPRARPPTWCSACSSSARTRRG